jgi:hypothetical protein
MKPHALTLIVERVDAHLAKKGTTRSAALKAAGVGPEAIRRIKDGIQPRLDTLEDIAVACGWNVGQLLGYVEIEVDVSRGNVTGELDPEVMAAALRAVRQVVDLLPPEVDRIQAEAELITIAYGLVLEFVAVGTSVSVAEASATRRLRRWTVAELLSISKSASAEGSKRANAVRN